MNARCELLSAHKGVSVAQLALSWVFNQRDLDVFALTSPVSEAMMHQNMEAAALRLSDAECRWLDLLSDSGPAEIGC